MSKTYSKKKKLLDPDEILAEKLHRKRKQEELEKALKDEYESIDIRYGDDDLSER